MTGQPVIPTQQVAIRLSGKSIGRPAKIRRLRRTATTPLMYWRILTVPNPALPIQEPDYDSGPNVVLSYRDPLNRPLNGTATIKLVGSPQVSMTADVKDGQLQLVLGPGIWSVGAMLRDPDGIRSYR